MTDSQNSEPQTTDNQIFGRPITEVAKELAKHIAATADVSDYIMTVDGPQSLDRLEAHALNTLRLNPDSVEANDKLALVREIRRLRALLRGKEQT